MPTVLITGTNRGFGLLMTEMFAKDGWRVLACCRNPDGATELRDLQERFADQIELHALDVSDFDAIDALAAQMKGRPVDLLLNNAGILGNRNMDQGTLEDQAFGNSDWAEWEMLYRVNTMAPMKMAEAFIEHVSASDQKKIVTLTSVVGSIGGSIFGGLYAYRASKAAANAVMKGMSIELAERGITAFPIHPGFAKTDMGGSRADIDPIEGAQGVFNVVTAATPDYAGRFWTYEGKELPW